MPLTMPIGIGNPLQDTLYGAATAGIANRDAEEMRKLEQIMQLGQVQDQALKNDRYSQTTPYEVALKQYEAATKGNEASPAYLAAVLEDKVAKARAATYDTEYKGGTLESRILAGQSGANLEAAQNNTVLGSMGMEDARNALLGGDEAMWERAIGRIQRTPGMEQYAEILRNMPDPKQRITIMNSLIIPMMQRRALLSQGHQEKMAQIDRTGEWHIQVEQLRNEGHRGAAEIAAASQEGQNIRAMAGNYIREITARIAAVERARATAENADGPLSRESYLDRYAAEKGITDRAAKRKLESDPVFLKDYQTWKTREIKAQEASIAEAKRQLTIVYKLMSARTPSERDRLQSELSESLGKTDAGGEPAPAGTSDVKFLGYRKK